MDDKHTDDERTPLSQVRQNRKDLEQIAESDLPAAWIAERLLDAAEEHAEG